MTLAELFAKLGIEATAELEQAVADYTAAQTTALKKNRDQLLKDVKDLKTAAKAFEGVDQAELAETLEALNLDMGDLVEHLKKPPASNSADVQKQIADAIAAAEKAVQRKLNKANEDLKTAQDALTKANKARVDEHIENALVKELAAQKGNSDLLLPMLRGRVKGEIDEEGKVVLTYLAANGDELQGAGGQVANASVLIGSIKADERFGVAFEADGGGSGAKGSGKRQQHTGKNPWLKGQVNLTEQARIRTEQPALAETLKKQAAAAA